MAHLFTEFNKQVNIESEIPTVTNLNRIANISKSIYKFSRSFIVTLKRIIEVCRLLPKCNTEIS